MVSAAHKPFSEQPHSTWLPISDSEVTIGQRLSPDQGGPLLMPIYVRFKNEMSMLIQLTA